MSLRLSTTDFGQLDKTGGLFFIGSNPTALQQQHGLSKWVELPASTLTLEPGQTTKLTGYINNDSSLAPGGHYGAINVSLEIGSSNDSTPNPSVDIHPVASTLLFITKLGGDTHYLKLLGVSAKHSVFNLPTHVVLNFQNTGNTHVTPRGIVTITGDDDTVVSKGIINQDSQIILPGANRLFDVPLSSVSSAGWIGQYHLRVDFRIDGLSQFRSYQAEFYYLSLKAISLMAVVIALLLLGIKAARNYRSWEVPKKIKK